MRLLLLIFFTSISIIQLNAQVDSKIVHYINKCKSCVVPLPGENFDKSGLQIFFPDSIYNSGEISIKSLKRQNFKLKRVKYSFQNHQIQYSMFYVKSKKHLDRLLDFLVIENQLMISEKELALTNLELNEFNLDCVSFHLQGTKNRKKWLVKLTAKK